MLKETSQSFTYEALRRFDDYLASSSRSTVVEQSTYDDIDLWISSIPAPIMEKMQTDFRKIMRMRHRAFLRYVTRLCRRGKELHPDIYVYFGNVQDMVGASKAAFLEVHMFSKSIALVKAGGNHYRRDGDRNTYELNRKYITRMFDILAKRYGLPLFSWMLSAQVIVRAYQGHHYPGYFAKRYATPADEFFEALQKDQLILERGNFRHLAVEHGETRQTAYGATILAKNEHAKWYENSTSGTLVKHSTFKLAREIGLETFARVYPYYDENKRGLVIWKLVLNIGISFDWHLNMTVDALLQLARSGELTMDNINRWTFKNVLGFIEKQTRKTRELRKRLSEHTYDLIASCVGSYTHSSVKRVPMPKTSGGKLVGVRLNQRENASHNLFLISAATIYLKFCLGASRSSSGEFLPLIDPLKVTSFAELQNVRPSSVPEHSLGAAYFNKIMSGEIEIILFLHELERDIMTPIGAAEILGQKKLGQLKGLRNGPISKLYAPRIASLLNSFTDYYSRDFNGSSGDTGPSHLTWNQHTKKFLAT